MDRFFDATQDAHGNIALTVTGPNIWSVPRTYVKRSNGNKWHDGNGPVPDVLSVTLETTLTAIFALQVIYEQEG